MSNPEIWKAAFGYEGIYEISNRGRVRRIKSSMGTRSGKILKPHTSRGYKTLALRKDGRYHTAYIHRLLMQSFVAPHGECVNHINGNRSDNRLANLEWCSLRENLLHATRQLGKRRGDHHWNSTLTSKSVARIKHLAATGKYKHRELAALFGVSRPQIGRVIAGKTWGHSE